MALPYIDTQRLSLVWLNLISPDRIFELESELIGSREIRGRHRGEIVRRLLDNIDGLPKVEVETCIQLQQSLGIGDGFRRQAVPCLLYRYFADMQRSFAAIKRMLKAKAKFEIIIGHNHTVIGGVRRDINTPKHLANLTAATGWRIDELIPLQTYQRYGYHISNAVGSETLLLLRNS